MTMRLWLYLTCSSLQVWWSHCHYLNSSGVRYLLYLVLSIPMLLCRIQNASKSARNQLVDFKKFPKCYLFCSIRGPEITATCQFCQDSNFLQPESKPLHLVTQADHLLPHVQGIPGSGHGEGAHCLSVPIRGLSPAYCQISSSLIE